ncbi:MAG: hypothetical protein LUE14_10080 [Clostridiales bacterium]|nr:hypothetical protein [Clostridiales bacterium]
MKIDFSTENLMAIHFFADSLEFPVAAAAYSEQDESMLTTLEFNFQAAGHTTESLCRWCISHKIQYRIIFLEKAWQHPCEWMRYKIMVKRLGYITVK